MAQDGLGNIRLRSKAAAEAIESLTLELPALAGKLITEQESLTRLENERGIAPLSDWFSECESTVCSSVEMLKVSGWSVLSLIPSAAFHAIKQKGEMAWREAVNAIENRLLMSFRRWKQQLVVTFEQDLDRPTRLLQFMPPDLSTDSNEELWPVKDRIAILVQTERFFS